MQDITQAGFSEWTVGQTFPGDKTTGVSGNRRSSLFLTGIYLLNHFLALKTKDETTISSKEQIDFYGKIFMFKFIILPILIGHFNIK